MLDYILTYIQYFLMEWSYTRRHRKLIYVYYVNFILCPFVFNSSRIQIVKTKNCIRFLFYLKSLLYFYISESGFLHSTWSDRQYYAHFRFIYVCHSYLLLWNDWCLLVLLMLIQQTTIIYTSSKSIWFLFFDLNYIFCYSFQCLSDHFPCRIQPIRSAPIRWSNPHIFYYFPIDSNKLVTSFALYNHVWLLNCYSIIPILLYSSMIRQ